MTTVCFDYDSIKYTIGFACENRSIVATHKNTKNSEVFKNRTKLKERLEEINQYRDSPILYSEYDIEDVQEMIDVDVIPKIISAKINGIVKHLGAKDFYGYIGKGKVFRHNVATIKEYKGGRSSIKPLAMNIIDELLFQTYNAKLATNGYEADDWLSIDSYTAWKDWNKTKHHKDRLVVVTEDKDALQCAGSHLFNPDKMVLPLTIKNELGSVFLRKDTSAKKLSGQGRIWLYAQMLLGDSVDNYDPTHLVKGKAARFGDVSCYNALVGCKDDTEALTVVVNQYKLWYPDEVHYVSHDGDECVGDWLSIANEIWQLARMKRWVSDDVLFSDVIKSLGIV